MKFQSIKTLELTNKEIDQILNLKNTYWEYGYDSQFDWFKKNAQPDDLHNVMKIKDNLIGYTFLGHRSFEIVKSDNKKESLKYTLFATLILKKDYRNYFYASKMMKYNSETIKKIDKPSFLLCHGKNMKFYKHFNWRKLDESSFNVYDHKTNLIGMIFNLKNIDRSNFNFYYYV